MTDILELKSVTKHFGGIKAVNNVSFRVSENEIVALIGPNGAGKTTVFNIITGVYKPDGGQIYISGKRVDGLPAYLIAKEGIRRTYQVVRPFEDATVLENLTVGAVFGDIDGSSPSIAEAHEMAWDAMCFMGLEKKADVIARDLNLGEMKRLELARALAGGAKIILLDEVLAGLNSSEIDDAIALIRRIRKELGKTLVVVEHIMRVVMRISDRIVVLHHGEKIADGTPEVIIRDPQVVKAYLGEAFV